MGRAVDPRMLVSDDLAQAEVMAVVLELANAITEYRANGEPHLLPQFPIKALAMQAKNRIDEWASPARLTFTHPQESARVRGTGR